MNKEKLKNLINRVKAEAPGKLEQGKKLALAGVRWMKAHKAITIGAVIAVFFVLTQIRECVVQHQADAKIAEVWRQHEEQEKQREKQREEQEKQREEQIKRNQATSELFRLLGGKYKNEDNLENRKALKRIRELIEIVGVNVKNSDSESLLFYAYKNGLQKNFVAVLTEAGASLSEDEAFEVNRLAEVAKQAAIEAFLKNPNEEALEKCAEYGVDFRELDKDEKKSLIFKTLKTLSSNPYDTDVSCVYFRPTVTTELLAQQGLKFRPEEKTMVIDAWARKFWQDFDCIMVAQGPHPSRQIESWRKEIFPAAKRLGAAGIDVLSVLNSQSKFGTGMSFLYQDFKSDGKIEYKKYTSDEAAKNTPLFLIELKKNEIKKNGFSQKNEHDSNRGFSLELDEIASLLKDFGATLTSDERAFLKKQSEVLKAGAKESLWESVSDRSLSTEQLSRILDVVGDLNGLYDNREVSILHNAYSWNIPVFEDSRGASFTLIDGEGRRTINVRDSSWYPLPSEQIELLKKHGATFKEGELQRLKYNATVWLKKYFLSTISPLRNEDNMRENLYMDDVKRIRRAFPLYQWGNAKDFLPTITEFAENELIEGVEYPSCLNEWTKIFEEESEQMEKRRQERKHAFRQSYVVGVGKLREVQEMTGLKGNFSDLIDGNRNKHSLLFIAWDKSFSKEFTDLLTARGFKYLDGEIELMRAITRARATSRLFILLRREDTKTKNLELIFKIKNLCKDLISDGADVNATLDGQSVLQIAQKEKLSEALIQFLQESGAK